MAEGEFALVRKYLERAIHKEKQSVARIHDLFAMLTDAAVRQRDLDGLLKFAPMLEKDALELDHKLYLATAHRAWGVAHRLRGDFEEAEARLKLAQELFRELDTHWQLGLTYYELGDLSAARQDPVQASENYTAALKLFEGMGALPDVARTQTALASLDGES